MKISINGNEIEFSDQPALNKQLVDSGMEFRSIGNPLSALALPFISTVDTEQGIRRLAGYQEGLTLIYKPDQREASYRIGDYSRHLRRYPIFGSFEGIFSAVIDALIDAGKAAAWLLPVVYSVGNINHRAAVAEIRVLSNPTEGEFLVVGKQRFNYKASAPIENDEILIGSDANATASNIAATISARPLSLAEAVSTGSTVTATANTPGLPLLVFSSTEDVEAETLIEAAIGGDGGSPQAITSAPVQFTAQGEYLDAALSALCARLGVRFRINPATGKLHIFQPGLSAAQQVSVAELLADCVPLSKRIESLSYRTTGPRATQIIVLGRNGALAKDGQATSYFETLAYEIEADSPRTGYQYPPNVDQIVGVRFTPNVVAEMCDYEILRTLVGDGAAASTGDGGAAVDAQTSSPEAIVAHTDGTIYFSEIVFGSPNATKIRKITAAGTISTFYDEPDDAEILALAIDSDGNVYAFSYYQDETFTDLIRIVKITPAGSPSDIVSSKEAGFGGDGGDAIDATLAVNVSGMCCDSADDLLIADKANNRIRKITFGDGEINTIAGTGSAGFSGDGSAATAAQLDSPADVAVDPDDNIYIADSENYRIRKIDAVTGFISTVAGNGTQGTTGDGGDALDAELDEPREIEVNASGAILIGGGNDLKIRAFAEGGTIDSIFPAYISEGEPYETDGFFLSEFYDAILIVATNRNYVKSIACAPTNPAAEPCADAEDIVIDITFSAEVDTATDPAGHEFLINEDVAQETADPDVFDLYGSLDYEFDFSAFALGGAEEKLLLPFTGRFTVLDTGAAGVGVLLGMTVDIAGDRYYADQLQVTTAGVSDQTTVREFSFTIDATPFIGEASVFVSFAFDGFLSRAPDPPNSFDAIGTIRVDLLQTSGILCSEPQG